MKKSIISGLLFIIVMLLGAHLVASAFLFAPNVGTNISVSNITEFGLSPFVNGTNLSGTIALNVTFSNNGTHDSHIVNITFRWNRTGTYLLNSTINNVTRNQTPNGTTPFYNGSFDTTLLADGLYNVTIDVMNSTGAKNSTIFGNITVDNTAPVVHNLTMNRSLEQFTVSSGNRSFNVTALDTLTNLSSVILEFDNATYGAFNLTMKINLTNNWTVQYNVSSLRGGVHTVKAIARDFAGNVNQGTNIKFFVNTPPNVTLINTTQGYNFTVASGNQSFNISVTNRTRTSNVSSIILQFDNASGNDFNITVNHPVQKSYGTFFWITYDVSSLVHGFHTVTVFANDTLANVNKSMYFNFTVDTVIPSVGNLTVNASNTQFTISSGNYSFNVTATDNRTNITSVTFQFNNASYGAFNLTALFNGSGSKWSRIYNISSLRGGVHTVKAIVQDFAGNVNQSINLTFFHNTAPNVTLINTTQGYNFTVASGNQSFNISALNTTTRGNVSRIFMEFDNASYGKFNVSLTNPQRTLYGHFFTASYNVSLLRGGLHTVTVFANDTLANVNKSITFNFTVNQPPNVTLVNVTTGFNFSATARNHTFNVSVLNTTRDTNVSSIVFQFDNGSSGVDFNRTVRVARQTSYGNFFTLNFNISRLKEGTHTVTIFANDTKANVNKSISFSFIVDRTAPTVTVSCDPGSANDGQDVTCTCTSSDGGSGLVATAKFGDGSTSQLVRATGSGTKESGICTGTDFAGNSKAVKGSFTVNSASSGGSSGGSGGGISRAVTGNFKKTTWTSINQGETASVEPENGEIGVSKISFGMKETKYGLWMKVAKKESIPEEFKPFNNKVHKIIEITRSLVLQEDVMEDPTIDIKVEKSWVNDNNLGRSDVALHRYHDEQWTELPTEFVKDDGIYLHYSVKTPGFSYFIIGTKDTISGKTAEELVEEAVEEEVPGEEPVAGEPTADGKELTGSESSVGRNVAIVLAVLVVIALVAFLARRKK